MIIGNGMMSKVFESYNTNNKVLIFASGVSNSNEVLEGNFHREKFLLKDAISRNQEKLIVYFSSCSIYEESTNTKCYVKHKLEMEDLIQKECLNFFIFRLPQVVGFARNQTLVNFLFSSILNNKKIDIYKHSTRNLISADDVFKAVSYLITNKMYLNEITNIATPKNTLVKDIVKIIENITGLSFNYNLLDCGHPTEINVDKILNLDLKFDFDQPNYLENVLSDFFALSAYEHK